MREVLVKWHSSSSLQEEDGNLFFVVLIVREQPIDRKELALNDIYRTLILWTQAIPNWTNDELLTRPRTFYNAFRNASQKSFSLTEILLDTKLPSFLRFDLFQSFLIYQLLRPNLGCSTN